MSITNIKFKARVKHHDPQVSPVMVEGYYLQDLDQGVIKHYIFNCPCQFEIDPSTLRIVSDIDLDDYVNPVTTKDHIKSLHKKLVQTCIDYIKENNLSDINEVNFSADGLQEGVKYGEWTPSVDSSMSVVGIQYDENIDFKVRKLIEESM